MKSASVKTVAAAFWQDWLCVSCLAQSLRSQGSSIACASCRKVYPLVDGIPTFVDDLEAHQQYIRQASLERPTWYLGVQRVARADDTWKYVRDHANSVIGDLLQRYVDNESVILDLGCGDGRNLAKLRETGGLCYGTDYNLTRLVRAAIGDGSYDALFMADAKRLPVPSGFFDVVYCDQVLEHIPNPAELLCSAHRILKNGGTLVLGVPNEGCWYHSLKFRLKPSLRRKTDHVNFFTLRTLADLLVKSGFSVQRASGVTWGLPATGDGVLALPTILDRRLRQFRWYNTAWDWFGRAFMPNQYFELYLAASKA